MALLPEVSVTLGHHGPKTLHGNFQKQTIHTFKLLVILSSMMKSYEFRGRTGITPSSSGSTP